MAIEHRRRLDTRLTPVHLYKITPRTNCGKCGFPTCLAFATQVIVGQGSLNACPFLSPEDRVPLEAQLQDQQGAGIGLKRESFEKALHFLRTEIRKWDLGLIAPSLGAALRSTGGSPSLIMTYFGKTVCFRADDVMLQEEGDLDPWEKILLYNYVIGGAVEPSGVWVGMESLPNSVSKIKSLKAHCEEPLARTFAGKMSMLQTAIADIGRAVAAIAEKADFAAEFHILPRLPVRVLWWDEDATEGFAAQTKFLFDSRVLQVIDLESLIFACEQLTNRLLKAVRG